MKTPILALILTASTMLLSSCLEEHHPGDGHDHGSESHREGDGHQH